MILTVTPNTAVDKTYIVENFALDRVHRPSKTISVAGGKGINVARVLKTLGTPCIATGFAGGNNGDYVLDSLRNEGIAHDFIHVEEESRLCIAVIDPISGTQTEVNENGPEVTSNDVKALLEKIDRLLDGRKFLVLCGSVPPGVPTSFYGDCIELARRKGVKTILDTSGEHLREAIKAGPYMVKPNIAELCQLVGGELFTLEEISTAARSIKQFGVEVTVVSMGRSGALVTDGHQTWKATPPIIEFASAVGSGDSLVAAFLDSLLRTNNMTDAIIAGTAAGAANATTYGAGFIDHDRLMQIKPEVTLVSVD